MTPKQIEAIALYSIPSGAPIRYYKIAAALKAGLTVMADLKTGRDACIVRDVRDPKAPQVLVLEGWRYPLRVWTKEQPELPFHLQKADAERTLLQ